LRTLRPSLRADHVSLDTRPAALDFLHYARFLAKNRLPLFREPL
jgi:hypothetical protein